MNHKARLKLIERKVNADETLQAILPSWLYDGYQPTPKKGEKVISFKYRRRLLIQYRQNLIINFFERDLATARVSPMAIC